MQKLLSQYRANPTYKKAQQIRAYDRAHMMASCMLVREDADLWATAIHHANRGEA